MRLKKGNNKKFLCKKQIDLSNKIVISLTRAESDNFPHATNVNSKDAKLGSGKQLEQHFFYDLGKVVHKENILFCTNHIGIVYI